MPRSRPNLLWRATPTPREVGDVGQLQTLVFNPTLGKADWVTIARGDMECIEKLAEHLSRTRYQMFPATDLVAPQPGLETEEEQQNALAELAAATRKGTVRAEFSRRVTAR